MKKTKKSVSKTKKNAFTKKHALMVKDFLLDFIAKKISS